MQYIMSFAVAGSCTPFPVRPRLLMPACPCTTHFRPFSSVYSSARKCPLALVPSHFFPLPSVHTAVHSLATTLSAHQLSTHMVCGRVARWDWLEGCANKRKAATRNGASTKQSFYQTGAPMKWPLLVPGSCVAKPTNLPQSAKQCF